MNRRVAMGVAGALVVALLLHTSADPDLWGHLAFGRQTVQDGLGRLDVFSYTALGAPVLNHEWLSDVVTYGAFAALGPGGVVALRLVLLAGTLLLIVGAVRRAGGDGLAAALVAALVVVGAFPWFVTARPQLYTFLFMATFLVAMVRADEGDVGALLATPVVTLAWVNLHGGVVAGLGVLGCWAGLRLAQWAVGLGGGWSRRTAVAVVVVLPLHVAAALATPFGPELWRFFAETLTVRRAEIGEWQHLSPTDLGDVLGVVALATFGLLVAKSPRARDPVHVVLMLALALAATTARRHLALAVIGAAVLGAPHAAAMLGGTGVLRPVGRRLQLLPATAIAVTGLLLSLGVRQAGCIVVEPGTVPDAAVTYLKRAGVEGKLAVLFDWGSYAIWHLAPRLRVSIDGRREALYSPAQLAENAAFLYGAPEWRAPLDRDGVDLALVSPRFAVYQRLAAEADWRLAFDDRTAALFVRRGSVADGSLAHTPAPVAGGGARCVRSNG